MAIRVSTNTNYDVSTIGVSDCHWYSNGSVTPIRRIQSNGMYNDTSTAAANCRITTTPSILRSTASSRDIKRDVEDLWDSQADLVLNLRPVKYYAKNVGFEDIGIKHYGFIAEEVGLVDPRLVDWRFTREVENQWGDEGETLYEELNPPEAEGVDYVKIPVLLTNIVKKQKQKIEELEEKLTNIESILNQLEVGA